MVTEIDDDTPENYRAYLSELISRTKSRGSGKYFNQYVNKCRAQAAARYPKGAAADSKKAAGFGILASIAALFGMGS
ncbi:MAG: hypothetical protein GXY45_11740 [Ramlibacter sp.]|nr:hypothetical protein [Ramlibacter sp.]